MHRTALKRFIGGDGIECIQSRAKTSPRHGRSLFGRKGTAQFMYFSRNWHDIPLF
jgi:hypothetical protein